MEETKGTSGTPRRGMLLLATWKATNPFKTAILGASEGATKIRDKLPLVDLTRMDESPIHLYTEVDPNRHMDASNPRKSAAPMNSKALTMSVAMESIPIAMSVMRVDVLTNLKDDATPIDRSTRRKVDKAMGLRLTLDPVMSIVTLGKVDKAMGLRPTPHPVTSIVTLGKVDKAMGLRPTPDPVTSIVTLGKVIHTAARGSPTRPAMTSTEEVIPTVSARVVMGVVAMGPLVMGTSGPHLDINMKVLRPRAMEKGRGSMGAMKTVTVPLVSEGLTCTAVMKITQSDEDSMIV